MTYVVLARKWRPQRFEELTGQEHVARTLQNAISSARIPHAVLFTGPRGVGKTSSARILSMALNCEHGPTPTPCGACQACIEVKNGRSVDILEIDGASNRGISEIRELRDSVQYAPSRDRFKVYIIDEVHMLTTEAFNALLKTLEEPPPHVVFIFATTEPQKLPVTIISRCQRFDFREIGLADLIARLEHILAHEHIEAEPDALRMIARQAAGGMRDALSLLDQVISSSDGKITAEQTADLLGATDRRLLFSLSKAVIERDVAGALQVLQRGLQRGTDTSWLAGEFAAHMRDLAVVAVAGTSSDLAILTEDELEAARAQIARTDVATLEVLLDLILAAAEEIARSSMATLRFELALIRMCQVPSQRRIDHLITLLEAHAGLSTPLLSSDASTTRVPSEPVTTEPSSAQEKTTRTNETPPPSKAEATRPTQKAKELRTADLSTDVPPHGAASGVPAPTTVEDASKIAEDAPEEDPDPEPPAIEAKEDPEPETSAPAVKEDREPETPVIEAKKDPEPETLAVENEEDLESSARTDVLVEDAPDGSPPSSIAADPEQQNEIRPEKNHETIDREPTFETWREAVNRLDDSMQFARRMLAMGHCIAEDDTFRVGVIDTYVQEREDLIASFERISEELFGRAWTLQLVEDTTLTDADRARAWVIRNQEEEEEEALRDAIQTRIAQHPLMRSVKERWPTYELRREHIQFLRLDDASTEEGENDV